MCSTGSRNWMAMAAVTAALIIIPLLGCSHQKCSLCDRSAELASNVELPEGFYPLKRHASLDDENDHYNGWPRYIVNARDRMVMCYVPSQRIVMGGGVMPNEVPARHVVVNHFYVDMHEVSNCQFYKFTKNVRCCPCKCSCKYDQYKAYWTPGVNDSHPVRNVSWFQAHAYACWAGKCLPTEAQWEAAARGSDGRIYPWGNDSVSEVTRYLCNARTGIEDFDGYAQTAPVMNYAAGVSPFGVFNMSGNVWEWCDDNYDPGRYAYPSIEDPASTLERGPKPFGDEYYPNPLEKDIREARVGPLWGNERVIRGGSFVDPIERCRADSRSGARVGVHQNNIGFRCVLPLPPDNTCLY